MRIRWIFLLHLQLLWLIHNAYQFKVCICYRWTIIWPRRDEAEMTWTRWRQYLGRRYYTMNRKNSNQRGLSSWPRYIYPAPPHSWLNGARYRTMLTTEVICGGVGLSILLTKRTDERLRCPEHARAYFAQGYCVMIVPRQGVEAAMPRVPAYEPITLHTEPQSTTTWKK